MKNYKKTKKNVIVFSTFFLCMFTSGIGVRNQVAKLNQQTIAAEKNIGNSSNGFGVIVAKADTTTTTTPPATTTTPSPTPVQPQISVTMNFETGEVLLKPGTGGSDKFYISTNKMKSWDLIDKADFTGDITIDLNSMMKSSKSVVYFKGNKDQTPYELQIPAEEKALKASYKVVNGKGSILFTGDGAAKPLQYRIGTNGTWKDFSTTASFSTAKYEITGATFQFRTKANPVTRAGKIINLKIPKRPTAPSAKVDGGKLIISNMKSGTMEYRKNNETAWTAFAPADTKTKFLKLSDLLISTSAAANAPIPAGTIEIRTKATDKKVASAVKTIELDAQRPAPTTDTVKLDGTNLTVTDASSSNPYEYTMLHVGETLDLTKAKWSSITSSRVIKIKKTGKADVIPGDILYIRKKAVKDKVTKEECMASLYTTMQITSISVSGTPTPKPTQKPTVTPQTTITPKPDDKQPETTPAA